MMNKLETYKGCVNYAPRLCRSDQAILLAYTLKKVCIKLAGGEKLILEDRN